MLLTSNNINSLSIRNNDLLSLGLLACPTDIQPNDDRRHKTFARRFPLSFSLSSERISPFNDSFVLFSAHDDDDFRRLGGLDRAACGSL